ncbi:hypothetical protein [Streptomyces sp. NPDC001717]|uniref:hypothetical protein n=1 Tax=Streptomyces sp. NPDC001717 TaxID=3364604 RepID=UPI0036B66B78
MEDDRGLRGTGRIVRVVYGLPKLRSFDGVVPVGEVVAGGLVHLLRDHRTVPVHGLPDVGREDPQRSVLPVHVTEDVHP